MSPIKNVAGQKVKEPHFDADEPRVPEVRVAAKGRVSQMLDSLAEIYQKANPGRGCRWVYSPLHKPELSHVLGRRAEGYQPVMAKELGEDIPGMNSEEQVRIADTILMSIEKEVQEAIQAELNERAAEQARAVDRAFYEAQDEVEAAAPGGEVHRSKARGRAVIEERSLEYDEEQRTE